MSFDALYAETENIPTITLYSDGQTTTYKPQSMREYELWKLLKKPIVIVTCLLQFLGIF